MSGGRLDYFYGVLEEHVGDFGDKELDELVADLATLFHDREWFLSGDTCEGIWRESRDAFKEKWFTKHGRQERIEKYLSDIAEEVRRTFGISEEYCKNCKHWTQERDGEYGRCEYEKYCLMHRSESCKKYENDAIRAVVDDAPAADVAPVVHGYWHGEYDGYADGCPVYDMWSCSSCGWECDDDEEPTWKYCPNCGAKMDEVKE